MSYNIKPFINKSPLLARVGESRETAEAIADACALAMILGVYAPFSPAQYLNSPRASGWDALDPDNCDSFYWKRLKERCLNGSTLVMTPMMVSGWLILQVPIGAVMSHTPWVAGSCVDFGLQGGYTLEASREWESLWEEGCLWSADTLNGCKAIEGEFTDEMGNEPARLGYVLNKGLSVASVRRTLRIALGLQAECSRYNLDLGKTRYLKAFGSTDPREVKMVANAVELRCRQWLRDLFKVLGTDVCKDLGFASVESAMASVDAVTSPINIIGRHRSDSEDVCIKLWESTDLCSALDRWSPVAPQGDGYIKLNAVMLA